LGDGVTAWADLPYIAADTDITPADIGLGNVDNTSDLDKPVSSATHTYVEDLVAWLTDQKADKTNPQFFGNPTAPTPAPGDNDTSIATTAFVKAAIDAVKLALHPVGSLYFSVNNVNPSTFIGGTWVAFGSGRVLVGVDTGQAEFDTPKETGGAKTHTLAASEIPAHTHTLPGNTLEVTATGGASGGTTENGGLSVTQGATGGRFTHPINHSTATIAANTGGGGAHNNLQPYITGYMWERTA
jgi:hypothetical protein